MLLTVERSLFSGVEPKVKVYLNLEVASATCIFNYSVVFLRVLKAKNALQK